MNDGSLLVGTNGAVVHAEKKLQLKPGQTQTVTRPGFQVIVNTGAPVEFALADATIHPFAPESFDLLASRFGVMFFHHIGQALTNLRRVLRPGARACFAVWGTEEQPYWQTTVKIVHRHVGGPLLEATSSEPDDAAGPDDGSTVGDIQDALLGTPDFAVLLRAERLGGGPGRTYTLRYRATDASGNAATGAVVVRVPHDLVEVDSAPSPR